MSADHVVGGHYRYTCPACGVTLSDAEDQMAAVAARHEGKCPMIDNAWEVLDAVVDEIAAAGASDEPQERMDSLRDRARGGAAVLASILGLQAATISKECGHRAQLRAAGTPLATPRSSAELRGIWEPL